MSKILNSKYRVCKSLKTSYKNVWGIKKKELYRCMVNKKTKKVTTYHKLLSTKQAFKLFYSNIKEKNFKKFVKYSVNSPCKTIDKLVSFVESRLDSVLFRSCFVRSFHEAKQLISHKYVLVNNRYITNSSIMLNRGDIVKLDMKNYNFSLFEEILVSRSIPNNLEIDLFNLRIIFLWDPSYKNSFYPINQNYLNIHRYYK